MGVITFTYRVIDGKNPAQKSEVILYGSNTGIMTTEDLAEVARDHLPVVRAILTGGIIDCTISLHPDMTTIFTGDPTIKIPDPDSDVEEGAKFTFQPLDGDITPKIMRLPTFNEDFIISGTRTIDITETEVALFIAAMLNDAFPYTFDFWWTNNRGEPLEYFLGAEENFKKRKNKR